MFTVRAGPFDDTRISDPAILINGTYQTGRLVALGCTRSTSPEHVAHPKTNSSDVKMLFINLFPPEPFVGIPERILKTTHMIITSKHTDIIEHKTDPSSEKKYYTRKK